MSQRTDQQQESIRCLDGFELIRCLGNGGMGVVYLAYDRALDRRVALKFSAPQLSVSCAHERLIREAKAVGRISHSNVVSLYGTGVADGQPYLVYEFVEGTNLDALPRPAPWPQVVHIGVGLSRALAAVHRHNVVHRDVKPANAIMTANGQIKLIDFGLATILGEDGGTRPSPLELQASPVSAQRLTDSGVLLGTPLFLAPERWLGAPPDCRSDIYSFGLLLYEQLVGELWLADLTVPELATFVCDQELQPLSIRLPTLPQALTTLVDRCIRREAWRRPQSMNEVCGELERIEASGPWALPDSLHPSTGGHIATHALTRPDRAG